MRRLWKSLLLLPVLVGLAFAGCESASERSGQMPTEPQQLLGLLGAPQGYTPLKDPLLPGITKSLSTGTLIGVDGGQVSLLGHTVVVPAGAVSTPTLFTITVLPTGYVEVDLSATISSALGTVLDVGGKGFLKPVPVQLTYSRATNVGDPTRLRVLRINSLVGYGKFEVMKTEVDADSKTVSTSLDHFSRYIVAFPN